MVRYLDTSAFLKLVVAEGESGAMRAWFVGHGPIWSSQLLRTEALRAGSRLGIDHDVIEDALDAVSLVLPRTSTFLAGTLPPPQLRTLDALSLLPSSSATTSRDCSPTTLDWRPAPGRCRSAS